jgi:hypothetical protein
MVAAIRSNTLSVTVGTYMRTNVSRRKKAEGCSMFLLGHVSIQTTERYLGCKQRFRDAVNDHIGLESDASS